MWREGRESNIGGNYMADVSTNTQRLSEKGASRDETRHAEQSAFTAVNGAQECYLRMLDMAQENTVAGP